MSPKRHIRHNSIASRGYLNLFAEREQRVLGDLELLQDGGVAVQSVVDLRIQLHVSVLHTSAQLPDAPQLF